MIELIPLLENYTHPLIKEELRKAAGCPKCGAFSDKLRPMTENKSHNPRYLLTCTTCDFQGPFGHGIANAVKRWNKPPSIWANLMNKFHKQPIYALNKPVQKARIWTS